MSSAEDSVGLNSNQDHRKAESKADNVRQRPLVKQTQRCSKHQYATGHVDVLFEPTGQRNGNEQNANDRRNDSQQDVQHRTLQQ